MYCWVFNDTSTQTASVCASLSCRKGNWLGRLRNISEKQNTHFVTQLTNTKHKGAKNYNVTGMFYAPLNEGTFDFVRAINYHYILIA